MVFNKEDKKNEISDNIMSLAIKNTKDITLTEYEFAKLMNFTDKEIDMLKIYWNPIFNDSWIYLSDELILGNLTNETKKDAIRHFYDRILLKGDFQEGIDYKEISPNDELVNSYSPNLANRNLELKSSNRKKYYAVTGETYKCLLLSSRTNQGKETRRYYIKVELLARNMKDYIFEHFKIQKQIEIAQTEKEKNKYLSLYNQQTQKHHFHKFKKTCPCFYIITQGIEYADGLTRIKIGICGASRRKISECPHCEAPLEDDKNSMSFDNRLSEHRVLWPMLKIEFAVYTQDCDLLERNMKRFYRKQINPNGHEIIENVSVSDVIKQTLNFLNLFNFYSDKENPDYTLEEDIDKYNENTLTHMKKHIIQIEEIKDKIEEKEHEVKLINNFIKEKEEEVKEKNNDIEEYKKHLNKKIGEFRDTELATILQNFGLSKYGLKQSKYDRLKEFVEKKIKDTDVKKDIKIKQEEDNEDKRIGRRPNNYQQFVDSLLSKKLSKHQLKNIETKKDFRYCNGFCQDYCVESEFKKNNSYYMTICNTCAKMVNFADILIKNRKYTIHEIIKDISKIRLQKDQQVCVECFIVKKQYCFEGDRNQCKDCRYKSNIGKVKNFDVSKAVTEIKTNIKNIDKYTKLEIHKIAGHLNIKRKDTDVKKDMIDKIKKHII